jgi:DNA modification methylase
MSEKHSLRVELISITKLKLNERNPKTHPPKQIRQLQRSIETFDFIVPAIVDRALNVIAGHGRILAVKALGWTEVPAIKVEHLTEAQAKAFMIADNRLTENAVWDNHLLAENLKELSVLDLDFSLDITGFEMGEIDVLIEGLTDPSQSAEDFADALPAITTGPLVSRSGDLWELDKHRLLCADATDSRSFPRLLSGSKGDMVFIDPPYNVRIAGNVSGLGQFQHGEFAMASGEMSEEKFTEFLRSVFVLLAHHSFPGSIHFVCIDWRHCSELLSATRCVNVEILNLCVWNKSNGGMGSFYRSKHELIWVLKNGPAPHVNNINLGVYGRNRTNVWDYAGANSFHDGRLEDLALHPTVKPVALVADAILDCSKRNGIVLDTFAGSGTTILAAERTGRRAYAMEIDPAYIDVAIRRFEKVTGKSAVHADTKKTFTEEEERRESDTLSPGGTEEHGR